jgi:hypothetical protein
VQAIGALAETPKQIAALKLKTEPSKLVSNEAANPALAAVQPVPDHGLLDGSTAVVGLVALAALLFGLALFTSRVARRL